jgi:hypothetical protein
MDQGTIKTLMDEFRQARSNFKRLFRTKQIQHHASLAFKDTKDHWAYINRHVKTKKDRSLGGVRCLSVDGA